MAAASLTTLCYQSGLAWDWKGGGQHHAGRMFTPLLGAESERGLLCSGPQNEALRLGCSLGPGVLGKCRRNVFQLLRTTSAPV